MKYMIAALLIVAGCSGCQDPGDSLFPVELGRYWKYSFKSSSSDGICGNGGRRVIKVVEYIVVAENRLKVIEGKKIVREISFDPRNVGLSIPLRLRVAFYPSDPDFFPPAWPEKGSREVIEVPAGRFDAIAFSMPTDPYNSIAVEDDDSTSCSTIRWFAPGVGLVRQTHKSYSQNTSSYASWELLSTGVYDRN